MDRAVKLYDLEKLAKRAVKDDWFVPGYDTQDLRQEAMIVMWAALQAGAPLSPGKLKNRARSRIIDLIRYYQTDSRQPKFSNGEPAHFIPFNPEVHNVENPQPPAAATPPCHPQGTDPEGYDPGDSLCHNCPDKFSCLQQTEILGLTEATVADDKEVESVFRAIDTNDEPRARLAYEIVKERQRRRVRLHALGEPIPEELGVRYPLVLPPEKEPARVSARIRGGSAGAPIPDQVFEPPEKMPRPRKLPRGKLDKAIARIRIGQPFELEIGHVLVRRKRNGVDVCVEIRENGFWLNLNQTTYGSHSTAARAAELLFGASWESRRPGNTYFSIIRRDTTEIRDAQTGAVLACRRGES